MSNTLASEPCYSAEKYHFGGYIRCLLLPSTTLFPRQPLRDPVKGFLAAGRDGLKSPQSHDKPLLLIWTFQARVQLWAPPPRLRPRDDSLTLLTAVPNLVTDNGHVSFHRHVRRRPCISFSSDNKNGSCAAPNSPSLPCSSRLLSKNMKRNRYRRASASTVSARRLSAILALDIEVQEDFWERKREVEGVKGRGIQYIHTYIQRVLPLLTTRHYL